MPPPFTQGRLCAWFVGGGVAGSRSDQCPTGALNRTSVPALLDGGARCAPPSADAPCNHALLQNLWFIVGTNHKRGMPLKSQEQSCAKSYSHPCENCPKAGDIAPVTNLSSPAEWCKTVNMPKFCYTHPGVRFARKSSQKSRKSLDSKPFTLYTETVSQKWNRAP